MSKNLLPDKGAIYGHLFFLFGTAKTGLIEIAYTPAQSGAVSQAEYFNIDQIEAAADFAFTKNSVEGINVYVGASTRSPHNAPFGRSNIDDFYEVHALWCDLDDAEAAKKAKEKYKDLPPSFIVVTGRHPDLRAQAWWKLDAPITDTAKTKELLSGVCSTLNGDKAVVDPIRVMRLGGTIAWPKKDGRIPEMTEIKTPTNATQSVSLDVFKNYFPAAAPVDRPTAVGGVDLKYTPTHSPLKIAGASVEDVRDHLAYINPDCAYEDWIAVGMALHAEGHGFNLWDEWSQRGVKYDPQVMRSHWKSFKAKGGVGYGTIVHFAKQGGWKPKSNGYSHNINNVQNTHLQDGEKIDLETGEIITNGATENSPRSVKALPLIYANDVQAVTDASDFVEDLLRDEEFSVIYGESNCGKTFFMLDLAMHVALGRKWRDKHVEQGGVIYAALEGGHGTKNRIVSFMRHHGVSEQVPLAIIPSSINFLDDRGDLPAFLRAVEEAKARLGNVRLIVIDTLARAISGGDENSSMDMGKLIIHADAVRQLTKAHIAFVHHSGKDAARGARGHSSLRAAVDTEIEISRLDEKSPSTVKIVKQREMEMIEDIAFSLSRVILGTNKRGKEVSSCVVTPVEAVKDDKQKRPMTPIQSFIYDTLVSAILDRGTQRLIDGNHVTCVSFNDLKEYLSSRGLRDYVDEDKAKNATANARVALKKMGKINFNAGYIWLV